jgi:hypothetical protein
VNARSVNSPWAINQTSTSRAVNYGYVHGFTQLNENERQPSDLEGSDVNDQEE